MFKIKNIFHKIYISLAVSIILLLCSAQKLLADAYGTDAAKQAAGLPSGDIPTYLGRFAGAALALSGSIFLFLVVYGGIIMMTSGGGEGVAKGKKIITWAVIGALILGAAYAITALVFQIFTT